MLVISALILAEDFERYFTVISGIAEKARTEKAF